jgi:hypothetical protein
LDVHASSTDRVKTHFSGKKPGSHWQLSVAFALHPGYQLSCTVGARVVKARAGTWKEGLKESGKYATTWDTQKHTKDGLILKRSLEMETSVVAVALGAGSWVLDFYIPGNSQ